MTTTNTDYNWFWAVRKRGRRYYLLLVDNNGDAPASAITDGIELWYDEMPDEITSDDTTIPIPPQYELPIIKACAAEVIAQDGKLDETLAVKIRMFQKEYEDAVYNASHRAIAESQQPSVQRPFDLRDDNY